MRAVNLSQEGGRRKGTENGRALALHSQEGAVFSFGLGVAEMVRESYLGKTTWGLGSSLDVVNTKGGRQCGQRRAQRKQGVGPDF